MPLVSIVLVPALLHNSLRLSSDIYRAPGSCTLYTILPPRLLVTVRVLVLNSSFPNTTFGSALGFAKLLTLSLVMEFHATSSLSLMLQPGLRSSVVTKPSSDVVLRML